MILLSKREKNKKDDDCSEGDMIMMVSEDEVILVQHSCTMVDSCFNSL